MLSYTARLPHTANPAAQALLRLMDKKQTNLCVAADVTSKGELLTLADILGPEICLFKTHMDIIEDFDDELAIQLQRLAEKHDFLLFEDRKFADIGKTVQLQYRDGLYHIADWAHITTAHTVAGPGSIEALKEVGLHKGRGLLLLAEMTPAGALATDEYTKKTVAMAEAHQDFVIGFIATKKLSDNPAFIYLSPGVSLTAQGDQHGQQYLTPDEVIAKRGCDIIIVGRGIIEADDPIEAAREYRRAGWKAYKEKLLHANYEKYEITK